MKLVALYSFAIIGLSALSAAAGQRILSSSDRFVASMSTSSGCEEAVDVNVSAESAIYFESNMTELNALLDGARAILLFECPKIKQVAFKGNVDEIAVFGATVESSDNWSVAASYPLQNAAFDLQFGNPTYSALETIGRLLERFGSVPGIRQTFQFGLFESSSRTIVAEVASSGTEEFQEHFETLMSGSATPAEVEQRVAITLDAIKAYAPSSYSALSDYTDTRRAGLKKDFWHEKLLAFIDTSEAVSEVVAGYAALIQGSSLDAESLAVADQVIASWVEERVAVEYEVLAEPLLIDLEFAELFVGDLGSSELTSNFHHAKALIERSRVQLSNLIADRLAALESAAMESVAGAGSVYGDVEQILDLGFAYSEEFDSAGFSASADRVLASTIARIEALLTADLPRYQAELSRVDATPEAVLALDEEARAFDELARQFAGFGAYRDAALATIEVHRQTICDAIVADAVHPRELAEATLVFGERRMTVQAAACALYSNGHVLRKLRQDEAIGGFLLAVEDADGVMLEYRISEWPGSSDKSYLIGDTRLGDPSVTIDPHAWDLEFSDLVLLPPHGLADAEGVTECDELAADPRDPGRVTDGVDFEDDERAFDRFERAIDACIAAVDHDPDNPRLEYQLGRLVSFSGDNDLASPYLKSASDAGYAAAQYAYGLELLGRENDDDAFVDAVELIKTAAANGYVPAEPLAEELDFGDVALFKEMPAPTGKELLSAFPRQQCSSALGSQVCFRVTAIAARNCFQTSATEFSCEYRPTLQCGTNHGGIYNMIFQAACSKTDWNFGNFQKLEDGKWRKLN